MSVPFSNTHLRVPRGFGAVLEGLAREVLRDQPGDIPEYAARHFQALLKKREESGMDPAEWAAKLEDRFYNNQAFQTTETDPEQETAGEVTSSQEETCESQAEDESSISTGPQYLSTAPPGVGEKAHETERQDEENNHHVTEKNAFSVETGLSEGESINRLPTTDIPSDEPSGVEEQADQAITALDHVDKAVNETDSSSVQGQNTPPPELESTDLLSVRGMSYADVCAQELGAAEDEGGDKQASAVVDPESVNSDGEDNNEVGEPAETFPHSRPTDVDVCASELRETERAMERGSIEADPQVAEDIKSIKPQAEGTVEETSLPRAEKVEGSQQEVEDMLGKTGEEEKTETEPPSEETRERLSHVEHDFDCATLPKEDSLVEVNFEDIPEAQQITEVVEKQPEEASSTELMQTETLQIEQKEEPKELIPSAIHQNISDAQKYHDFESEGVRKEVDSEEEKEKSLQDSTDKRELEENVVKIDSNLNYCADESGINTENISSSDQPTTESEKEKQEEEIIQGIEDNETVNEGTFHHYEDSVKETGCGFKEVEKTDALEADEEEIYKEGHREMEDGEINDGGAGNNSSQVTHSSTSVVPAEPESEMFEESAQDLAEEEEESERTLGESQPGDTKEKKEATSNEAQEVNQKEIDFEVQEKSAEESVSLWTAADHQDVEKPLEPEEHPTQLAGQSEDKEECSRPQEEEDIMDIPLDDPEANRAAAKIQAGFRGHMTRKKMKPEDKAEGEERQEDRGQ